MFAALPLYRLIEAHVLAAGRLHGDDTTVPILAKGKTVTVASGPMSGTIDRSPGERPGNRLLRLTGPARRAPDRSSGELQRDPSGRCL